MPFSWNMQTCTIYNSLVWWGNSDKAHLEKRTASTAIFIWPWKVVSASARLCSSRVRWPVVSTFVLERLEKLSFFIDIICWAQSISQVQSTGLPSIFLSAKPWSVHFLFYQPMDGKIKTWSLCFPAKGNPNMQKALFDWPIKAKYHLISGKFSGMKVFHPSVHFSNQIPPTFVSIW